MRYTQKAKEIEAFTFPLTVEVSLIEPDATPFRVPAGDYLLFIDGTMSVMSKKEFSATHDLATQPARSPRIRKPSVRKGIARRGLGKAVLEQRPNGAEHDA